MEKQKLLVLIFVFVVIVPIAIFATNSAPPPNSRTGAPGEQTCVDGCHNSFVLDSGTGSVAITGAPATYALSTDYTITVTVTQSGLGRYGFEATAQKTSDSSAVGTFTAGTGSTVSGNYVKHGATQTSGSGSKSWSFTWRSPSSDEGEIKFYAAGNATNSSGTNQGDYIYTTSSSGIIIVSVELSSFNYIIISINDIQLKWETYSETNNYGFDIERSIDNKNYEKIGFVRGNGSTLNNIDYIFTDSELSPGKYYYRLKQVDYDGTYEYSSVVKATVKNPDKFVLSQNYPNPFNPETTIRYAIPTASRVRLTIYNVYGQEIKTLVNEEKSPGSYVVKWNGTNNNGIKISSGVYLYKINAGENVDVKKLILLN